MTKATDLADRKRADDLLQASEVRYRRLFETAKDGILILDADTGEIVDANPFVMELTGYSHEDFLGKRLWEIGPFKDIAASKASFAELQAQGYVRYEDLPLETRDGRKIDVEFVSNAYRVGNQNVIQCNIRDITAHKRAEAERERLEDQLRASQKLEALGTLTGGIAHDFNNTLTVIRGNAMLALEHLQDGPAAQYVRNIVVAGQHAIGVTAQLLAFSRRQLIEPRVLDLNGIVATMGRMLERLLGDDIRIETSLAPDLWSVKADPTQLEQVLLNLEVNARDAMSNGGRLSIETSNVSLDEAYTDRHPYARPGDHVMLAVTDTGAGMDASTLEHIFEPFFTTKTTGHGTGLGLSTVYGIVKQNGGSIEVYSEVGRGSTFKVFLPRVEGLPASILQDDTHGELPMGDETLLLVEDDPEVAEITRLLLHPLGYHLLTASSGEAAMQVARDHAGPIHLLLTDVVMPGMYGPELARELRKIRPDTRVLFVSGYTENEIARGGVLKPGVHFLGKPYSRRSLAFKVRVVLDAEATSPLLSQD